MKKVLGICDLHNGPKLGSLADSRPLAATSFLSRYGLIDFPLSNFSNSGIDKIAVLVEENMNAIRGHILSGNIYINNTKTGFIRLLMNEKQLGTPFNTDLNNLMANRSFMDDVDSDYIVVAPAHFLASMDFREIIKEHEATGADITVVYSHRKDANKEYANTPCLEFGAQKEVTRMFINSLSKKERDVSLETYIFKSSIFNGLLDNSRKVSSLFTLRDMVRYAIDHKQVYVRGYEFKGYVAPILCLNDYVKRSFELLNYSVRQKLFLPDWPIYTSTHNTPPTLYTETADVKDSFIANGCIIKGKVENSVLSRGVIVEKGAVVKNCIIFAKSIIGENAHLEYVVMDRNAKMKEVKELSGKEDDVLVIGEGELI